MTMTRRSFLAAALAALAAPLFKTTSARAEAAPPAATGRIVGAAHRVAVDPDRCDGADCDVYVDFDPIMVQIRALHYWPSADPQRYQAWYAKDREEATAWLDAVCGRTVHEAAHIMWLRRTGGRD